MMRRRYGPVLVMTVVLAGVAASAQQGRGDAEIPGALQSMTMPWPPMHVYLRAGLKTHGPGAHDYPQFLADWSKILTERGAIVDGSYHFPTTAELSGVNVIVMYKGDAGYMSAGQVHAARAQFALPLHHHASYGGDSRNDRRNMSYVFFANPT